MNDPYRKMLAVLLPIALAGCDGGGTGTTGDTATERTDLEDGRGCVVVDEAVACPAADEVEPADIVPFDCGATTVAITGPGDVGVNPTGWKGTAKDEQWCCYPTRQFNESTCTYGRPYVEDGQARVAAPEAGAGWAEGPREDRAELPAEARQRLAEAWIEAAQDEHAAVAAFSRIALELLAAGAPASLVARTTLAATEEVRHAELGFALASGYAGHAVRPSGFPFGREVPLSPDLASLAVAAFREGCVGETLTTLVALECRQRATDPAVRHALDVITTDEQGHAALAWATVRWALEVGGPAVRQAVAAALEELLAQPFPLPDRLADGAHEALLVAHGLPTARLARQAIDRGLAEVVVPCARALLGADRSDNAGERGAIAPR